MQRFMRTLEQARDLVTQYKQELDAWKEDVATIKAGKMPPERKALRPQKESIIEQLTRIKEEAKEQPRQRKVPRDFRGIWSDKAMFFCLIVMDNAHESDII